MITSYTLNYSPVRIRTLRPSSYTRIGNFLAKCENNHFLSFLLPNFARLKRSIFYLKKTGFMQLSENFRLKVFTNSATALRLGIKNIPGVKEIENIERLCSTILQPVRERFGKPIKITSGFRCPRLNKAVGGSKSSQHLYGEAADIVCGNNFELWNLIKSMIEEKTITVGQLINEKNLNWIHVSLPFERHVNQIFAIK